MRSPGLRRRAPAGAGLLKLAGASSLALVTSVLACGFEYAPVGAVPASQKPGRRLDFLVGLGVGTNTNVTRASASTESDAAYEILAGAELAGNYTLSKYVLSAEMRYEMYGSLSEYGYLEYNAGGCFLWNTKKAKLGVDGRCAILNDPVEVETYGLDLLKRLSVSYAPRLGFTLGKSELEVAYGAEGLGFEEGRYRYLDHWDRKLDTDFSLWTRPLASQFFLHYDSGAVDYLLPYAPYDPDQPYDTTRKTYREDFNYTRFYGGLRAGSARKAHYEVGAGIYTVSRPSAANSMGPVFSFRSTILRDEGNSKFGMTYSISPEAAATADYKLAQRMEADFVRQVNARWRWGLAYRFEISAFADPDPDEPTSLSLQVLKAGLQRDLGSGRAWRGRLHCTLGAEFGQDFDRFRAFIGAGFVR